MLLDLRVRRLKVFASRAEDARHGAIVIEDALRTASFSGLPKNGLLLIRRLCIGQHPGDSSSVAIARQIDKVVLALKSQIVSLSVITSGAEEQPQANIVWFQDAVAPYILLAGLLIHNIIPKSWYWPVAVPNWSPHMDIRQGLRHILFSSCATNARESAGAQIITIVINNNKLDSLLRHIEPDDGKALLSLCGFRYNKHIDDRREGIVQTGTPSGTFSDTTFSDTPSLYSRLPLAWQQALRTWIPFWGEDARSVWLAHTAVIASNTASTPQVVERLIEGVLRRHRVSGSDNHSGQQVNKSLQSIQSILSNRSYERNQPQHADSEEITKREGKGIKLHQISPADSDTVSRIQRTRIRHTKSPVDYEDGENDHEGVHNLSHSVTVDEEEQKRNSRQSACCQQDHSDHTLLWDIQGFHSEYAGLPFLIQTLEWVGIRDTLSDFPELAEWNLPARIFRTCIDKLKIGCNDPVCTFLSNPSGPLPLTDQTAMNFIAPRSWQKYSLPPVQGQRILALRKVKDVPGNVPGSLPDGVPDDVPGKNLITDASGRILLACWTDTMPDEVRQLTKDCKLIHLPAAEPLPDMDRIVNAFILAMIRFLRRYAKMGLRRLVTRPGYVATTSTHLDITFRIEQVDFLIRQAGLDIDPAWVPWLARVVQFHYIESSTIQNGNIKSGNIKSGNIKSGN